MLRAKLLCLVFDTAVVLAFLGLFFWRGGYFFVSFNFIAAKLVNQIKEFDSGEVDKLSIKGLVSFVPTKRIFTSLDSSLFLSHPRPTGYSLGR